MIEVGIGLAAVLLSLERVTYIYIGHRPSTWLAWCHRPPLSALGTEPVVTVRRLFIGFKALQIAVFLAWCMIAGATIIPLPTAPPVAIVAGLALMVAGQVLSTLVFRRLGGTGVFFGAELGYGNQRAEGFPFSLVPHPQYVGAVLSVWGFFLIMRYPNPDWLALPLLETTLYVVGAHLEP